METKLFDVIIIGGSYAGLSAAMALGRSLRNTLVIDHGKACNAQTPQSHNFLTQDGIPPLEISSLAKQQVKQYSTVQFVDDWASEGQKVKEGFRIQTQSKGAFTAKKLIIATGVKDIMPNIAGFAACWGISVIHCPYCHGYEYRNQKTGIMANGDKAFHMASMVNNLTAELSIFTSGKADFSDLQLNKFKKHQIKIIESEIAEIEHKGGYLSNVILKNGQKHALNALYAAIPFEQQSKIPTQLACELTEEGYIKIDEFQSTSTKGILACGDSTTPFRSVANAVASGNFAGALLNKVLVDEHF